MRVKPIETEGHLQEAFIPTEVGAPEPDLLPTILKAMEVFIAEGTIAAASRAVGMTPYMLGKYAKTPWWTERVMEHRNKERAKTDTNLTMLLGLTLEKLEDVIRFGEEKISPKGEVLKVELGGLTLAKIAEVVFDRRQILRGEPTSRSEDSGKLADLASKLEELSNQQRQIRDMGKADVIENES